MVHESLALALLHQADLFPYLLIRQPCQWVALAQRHLVLVESDKFTKSQRERHNTQRDSNRSDQCANVHEIRFHNGRKRMRGPARLMSSNSATT